MTTGSKENFEFIGLFCRVLQNLAQYSHKVKRYKIPPQKFTWYLSHFLSASLSLGKLSRVTFQVLSKRLTRVSKQFSDESCFFFAHGDNLITQWMATKVNILEDRWNRKVADIAINSPIEKCFPNSFQDDQIKVDGLVRWLEKTCPDNNEKVWISTCNLIFFFYCILSHKVIFLRHFPRVFNSFRLLIYCVAFEKIVYQQEN